MHRRVKALCIGCVVALSWRHVDIGFASPQTSPSRREVMGGGILAAVTGALGTPNQVNAYELMPLPYPYGALEPSIDARTMEIHHGKHHNTYITNINKYFGDKPQPPLHELQKNAIRDGAAVRNNGGGAYNHNFFWLNMAPTGTGGEPSARLQKMISDEFGSMDAFKEKFEAAAAPGARFGSGWVWLIVDQNSKLVITSTPNQDNPLMEGGEGIKGIPILALDVWEHAYYLKYQWQRPAYVKAWWNVVNWGQVSRWYEDALLGQVPTCDNKATAASIAGFKNKPPIPTSLGFRLNIETSAQFGS